MTGLERYQGDPRRVAMGDELTPPGEAWHVAVTGVTDDAITVEVIPARGMTWEPWQWDLWLWELDGWTVTYSPRDVAGI